MQIKSTIAEAGGNWLSRIEKSVDSVVLAALTKTGLVGEARVKSIIEKEASNGTLKGVIVQFGGQTPLKLAQFLDKANVPILGTSPDAIDLAEDRDRFKALIDRLGLRQPKNGVAYSLEQALSACEDINFPVVVRPSYVLGGRAMAILPDQNALQEYFETTLAARNVSSHASELADQYWRDYGRQMLDELGCSGEAGVADPPN